jgi:hypothetical protein
MTLLDLFLTGVTFIMTFHTMYTFRPALIFNRTQQFGHSLYNFVRGTHPDIAWAVLLCDAIFLYYTLMPSRRATTQKTVQ